MKKSTFFKKIIKNIKNSKKFQKFEKNGKNDKNWKNLKLPMKFYRKRKKGVTRLEMSFFSECTFRPKKKLNF
jgi:hypothetical protein